MVLIPIVVLVAIVAILIFYNIKIKKQITTLSDMSKKVNNLNVLQNFMDITGEDISVDEKIRKVNEILIEKFEIKYSTIVVFNGAEYILKASNTDQKYWPNLMNLHMEDVFKESISNAVPKYITVDGEGEKLPYQKLDFGRAKSAIFFPLFSLLEDLGYLPRVAFNMDGVFQKCGSCGKQSLTMMMGFGCNAVGVTGSKIIEDEKQRKLAMLTNAFVPCNGRFPMIISIIAMFLVGTSNLSIFYKVLLLTLFIILCLVYT